MEVDEPAVAPEPAAIELSASGDAVLSQETPLKAVPTAQEGELVSDDEDDAADDDEEPALPTEPSDAGLVDTVPCLEDGCGRMFKSIIALKRHAAVHRKKKRSARPPGSAVCGVSSYHASYSLHTL